MTVESWAHIGPDSQRAFTLTFKAAKTIVALVVSFGSKLAHYSNHWTVCQSRWKALDSILQDSLEVRPSVLICFLVCYYAQIGSAPFSPNAGLASEKFPFNQSGLESSIDRSIYNLYITLPPLSSSQ